MNAGEDTTEQGWKLLDRTVVHRGRVILSQHSIELPNGDRSLFEVDESIPFAVAVLLADSSGMLQITRQYRYPIDQWIYDLPGGGGNVGEEPRAAARRECLEEIGMIPIGLEHLHTFYSNPGRSAWPVHLYFTRAADSGEANKSDPTEQVHTTSMTVEELDSLIRNGAIVDPSLLIARIYAGLHGLLPTLS